MGGIYISCGDFSGSDKSCSAIDGVIREMMPHATEEQQRALLSVNAGLDSGNEYTMIEAEQARILLPLVVRYREQIEALIAPIRDPFDQMQKDFDDTPSLNPTEAKYGKSVGWRYYCALDLEKAFTVADGTGEPAVLTWD